MATTDSVPRSAASACRSRSSSSLARAFLIAFAVGAAVIVTCAGRQSHRRAGGRQMRWRRAAAVQKEFEQSRLQQLQLRLQLIAADPSFAKYVAHAGGVRTTCRGSATMHRRPIRVDAATCSRNDRAISASTWASCSIRKAMYWAAPIKPRRSRNRSPRIRWSSRVIAIRERRSAATGGKATSCIRPR